MNYDREYALYLHMKDLEDELLNVQKELQYFGDFLSWMNLWDDFIYFRKNSYLMQDLDEPFPRYVL